MSAKANRAAVSTIVSRARMYEVIRSPLITEKTTNGSEHSQVTFQVAAGRHQARDQAGRRRPVQGQGEGGQHRHA